MSVVPVWRLFAYMDDDDEGASDERRLLAEWQVQDALRWCVARGYDHIYLNRGQDTTRFQRPERSGVVHHFGDTGTDGTDEPPAEPEGSVA